MKLTNDQQKALDMFIDFVNTDDAKYMIIQGDSIKISKNK